MSVGNESPQADFDALRHRVDRWLDESYPGWRVFCYQCGKVVLGVELARHHEQECQPADEGLRASES